MLKLAGAKHLPRRTVRLRLTLLYGALFLFSGAALLAITYFFVDASTGNAFIVNGNDHTTIAGFEIGTPPPRMGPVSIQHSAGKQGQKTLGTSVVQNVGPRRYGKSKGAGSGSAGVVTAAAGGYGKHEGLSPKQLEEQTQEFMALAYAYNDRERRQLLIESGIALAIMAVVSVLLGWLMAGRVLRPLRTITATTRDISASNLHERLGLRGPDDELKELGDTIDGLLERLDASFRSQRQFVANASHELRTPLARQRTLAQVALADPTATAESLRAAHERILVSGEQQEQLIDALLTLSRAQSSTVSPQELDLAELTQELVSVREEDAAAHGVRVVAHLEPAPLAGDPRLVERLVANLLDNAVRHNTDGGTVMVRTGTRSGGAWLVVSNDGAVVSPEQIQRLYEPFERLGAERTARGEGFGLGLCIVRAVAAAHDATLHTVARPAGGLSTEVRFPAHEAPVDDGVPREVPATRGAGTDPAAGGDPAEGGGGRPQGEPDEARRTGARIVVRPLGSAPCATHTSAAPASPSAASASAP
jgi:signal transduction histidine kinase